MTFGFEIGKRTLWMEGRGEPLDGQRAIAHAIANRLASRRWGPNLASVCLSRFQFSCWNTIDPNRGAMALLADDNPELAALGEILQRALDGSDPDPTDGATHYYAETLNEAPSWVAGATFKGRFGRQLFYGDVR